MTKDGEPSLVSLFRGKHLSSKQRKKIRRAAIMIEEVVQELKDSGYPVDLDERLRAATPKGPIQDTLLGFETEIWLALTKVNSLFGLIAFKIGQLMG